MALTQQQVDKLIEATSQDKNQIVAFRFPGGSSEKILYANWVPFYVWDVYKETQRIDAAPVPYSQREDYSERQFTFRGEQFEDFKVVTPELLVAVNPKDKKMIKSFRRFVRLEGLVRYRWGPSREYNAVGRVYGIYLESTKRYINLGMYPSDRLSLQIPGSIKRKKELIIARRRELIGRRFSLDSVLTFPAEAGGFSLDAILLEKPEKKN